MIKCPYCAEEIQSEAIKCRYCGEWLKTKPSIGDVSDEQLKSQEKLYGQDDILSEETKEELHRVSSSQQIPKVTPFVEKINEVPLKKKRLGLNLRGKDIEFCLSERNNIIHKKIILAFLLVVAVSIIYSNNEYFASGEIISDTIKAMIIIYTSAGITALIVWGIFKSNRLANIAFNVVFTIAILVYLYNANIMLINGAKFVMIPPGTFMMGSPSDEPERSDYETQHQVTLAKGYYMQTTEVTQGQWRAVMGNNPSSHEDCGDNCPVEGVSWNDVQTFISKLNSMEWTVKYRLPTEAEWEYACRAGSKSAYCYGNDGNLLDYACYDESYREYSFAPPETSPVGYKRPNAWGLYDMHGNVWEWCQDWFDRYPTDNSSEDLDGNGLYPVVRGGSCKSSAKTCRSAFRSLYPPDKRGVDLGFRLVKTW